MREFEVAEINKEGGGKGFICSGLYTRPPYLLRVLCNGTAMDTPQGESYSNTARDNSLL